LDAEVAADEWAARRLPDFPEDSLAETFGRDLFQGLRSRAATAEEGAWSFAA
jgi:hypothetical protein